jgi:hypothetical protein
MSYNLFLECGCNLYVAVNPSTGFAHKRVIEHRGICCRVRRHEVGLNLSPWEVVASARDPHRTHTRRDPPIDPLMVRFRR